MSTPPDIAVKLSNPQDVLAAVPHLLGFTPTDSLVVVTVHDAHVMPRFGMTMRVDLPKPDQMYPLADYLLNGPLRNQRADAVLLVVIGRQKAPPSDRVDRSLSEKSIVDRDDIPHHDLIDGLHEVLGGAGIAVLHAAWTPEIRAGAPWLCYDHIECRGEIVDPKTSPLAAAMTAAGVVTFGSREELQQLVAPDPEDILARRAAKLDVLAEDAEEESGSVAAVKRDLNTVFSAIRRTEAGGALTEEDYLRALLALSDHRVRDLVLGMALGDLAHAAEQLWLTLVRMAPAPELAEVASLLAFFAYLRGEGALANVALERVDETRPDHRLGTLLRQAIEAGISSTELAVIAEDAAEDARIMIDEEGGDRE